MANGRAGGICSWALAAGGIWLLGWERLRLRTGSCYGPDRPDGLDGPDGPDGPETVRGHWPMVEFVASPFEISVDGV